MAHDLKNRTTDVLNAENKDKTFEYFQFMGPLLEGLQSHGYRVPSPIQVAALPYTLAGLDVLIQSKSGTGKTLAYVLSALSSIDLESNALQGLLIAPTREIAVQGAQTMLEIGSRLPKLKASTFIGGMSMEEDKLKLSKCHMAFGSPGRVKQLILEGFMSVSELKVLILDEADKLCEKSFKEDIEWIMGTLPETRQTIALSATYPESLENTLMSKLKTPTHVRLGQECQVLLGVNQFVLQTPSHALTTKVVDFKFQCLLKLISSVSFEQCVVFCNYALRARAICDKLNDQGWPAIVLSGMQEQKARLSSLKDLRSFKCRIVLTTDLSARGIDARHVNVVVNFDVPSSGTTYLHRIGRAGRYGSKGVSLSLASKGKEMKGMSVIAQTTNSEVRIIENPELDLWDIDIDNLETLKCVEDEPIEEDAPKMEGKEESLSDKPKIEKPKKTTVKSSTKKSKKSSSTLVNDSIDDVSEACAKEMSRIRIKNAPMLEVSFVSKRNTYNPPSSISQNTMNYFHTKGAEFESSLKEMNQLTQDMSLESLYNHVKEDTLMPPKTNHSESRERIPQETIIHSQPFRDFNDQWIQLWEDHQSQHREYMGYMLQCQGIK